MRILLWLSNNLRLSDNPALHAAVDSAGANGEVLPVYIKDTANPWPIQGAAAWWLHHSLAALANSIKNKGGELSLFEGNPATLVPELVNQNKIDAVYLSQSFEPYEVQLQANIHKWCKQHNIECKRFAGHLLLNPDTHLNKQGKPFQVFTPYYKAALAAHTIPHAKPIPSNLAKVWAAKKLPKSVALNKLKLLPTLNWADQFNSQWQPGEEGAHKNVREAIEDKIASYTHDRDFPAVDGTSLLSAHLRFGEISPRQIWQQVATQMDGEQCAPFLRQLMWRDFSYALLHHWPHIPQQPFKQQFEKFPWQKASNKNVAKQLHAWQTGTTGYPIVDAGMRQLWQTRWMHNRVRMIVASFLTKHLRIHWHEGAKWFWDTLVDADLANNTAGWQWVAGCGADAAPYFRIFNPVLQGEKFDKQGDYIKTWVPELAALPAKFIHAPWLAPQDILQTTGITLGNNSTYPLPIVDHKYAREAALAAYQQLKGD